MSYVKNYDIGRIRVEENNCNFAYELPLISFGDILYSFDLSLIIHSRNLNTDPANLLNCKTNLQKKLIMKNGIPSEYEDGYGKRTKLNDCSNKYTFDDESQRILRKSSTKYVLENPDGSKEYYVSSGMITCVEDKHGENILVYTYSSYGVQIVYRTGKTISINYEDDFLNNFENNTINSIRFSCGNELFEVLFNYENNLLTVNHFSGVSYNIEYYPNDKELIASTIVSENASNNYREISCDWNIANDIKVIKKIGNTEVDKINYTFYNNDENETTLLKINNNDVITQVQYQNKKAAFSYENPLKAFLGDSQSSIYTENININNNDQIIGFQTCSDGIRMTRNSNNPNIWSLENSAPTTAGGPVIISGWIKAEQQEETFLAKIRTALVDSADDRQYKYMLLPYAHWKQWIFFAGQVETDNLSHIEVSFVSLNDINGYALTDDVLLTRDIRAVLQNEIILAESNNNHVTAVEDILFDENENRIIPITEDLEFRIDLTPLDYETNKITANDILKYIINQHLETNDNEIYYNNSKGIITTTMPLKVNYNNVVSNVTNFSVGKKWCVAGNLYTVVTGYSSHNIGTYLTTKSYVNGTLYKQEIYDDKLDLISIINENTTVNYFRNSKGLVYHQQYIDNDGNNFSTYASYNQLLSKLLTTTDEFGVITTYETNDVTGVITKATLSDGTSITDTFDDGYAARIERRFSHNDLRKIHNIGYSQGFISSISDESGENNIRIPYGFAFNYSTANTITNEVNYYDNTIEKHVLTKTDDDFYGDIKINTSYYPSSTNCKYSVESKLNEYDRPFLITGLIQNQWDAKPEYSNGSYTVLGVETLNSKLASTTDLITTKTRKYAYDKDRLYKTAVFNSSGTKLSEEIFSYDSIGRLKNDTYVYDVSNGKRVSSAITYTKSASDPNPDNRVYTYDYSVNGVRRSYTYNNYDSLKRLNTKTTEMASGMRYTRSFSYHQTRLSSVSDTFSGLNKGTDNYTYDIHGRIVSHNYSSANITSDSKTYVYDSFGQLVRENNEGLDKTILYCYNDIGNIVSAETFGYTTGDVTPGTGTIQNYTYDETYPDRLTSFNGKAIAYNSLHCPSSYDKKTYIWGLGRLREITYGSSDQPGVRYENCRFNYDAYGRRISKTYVYDNNVSSTSDYSYRYTTNYEYDQSGRLIHELLTETMTYSGGGSNTYEFTYLYDETGIIGVLYNVNNAGAIPYYYRRNAQGDVVAIYDADGNRKVEYAYDAFGNCSVIYSASNTLAARNPIRYRGYYYDRETKLYYLNSRYYNPEWRRFISPDSPDYLDPETPNGLNLYAYCNNDPVNYRDPSGHLLDYILDAAFIAWELYDIFSGGYKDWKNWAALGIDVVFAALPFIPSGGGQVIKVGNKIDNAVDVANAINKIDDLKYTHNLAMIGRSMDRVKDTASLIGKSDSIYRMWHGFDAIIDFNKPLGYVLSGVENGAWMLNKLRKGYTIVDIGITTTHVGLGWYYGIEKFTIAQWKYRNLWKIPVNLL